MIETREFREDLYFRLNVIPLRIPPLRERPEDIAPLLEFALEKFSVRLGKAIHGFSEEAEQALLAYHWPGNVRELENTVEFAVNMESGNRITLANLPDRIRSPRNRPSEEQGTLKERTDRFQEEIIRQVLRETGTSLAGKRQAAELLDISESTLYRRIRELGIG